ncbi:MAG: hypothetical protein HYY40_03820, partial [Bacteroidetes bacterium]|nr:hypothetical protein [Bacteroidota bacterium]
GIYGYQIGTGNNSGGAVGAYSSSTWGGLGYSDVSGNRWGMYTPANAKIEGYLLVGNPSAPATNPAGQYTALYSHSFDAATVGWSQLLLCGANTWYYGFSSNNGRLYWPDGAAFNRAMAYSPWIWLPDGISDVHADFNFSCTTENNYDGVFLEYTTNGSTWTKITAFDIGPYPDNADGSNTSCSGTNNQSCWNGTVNGPSRTSALGISNTWIQFRFTSMSDNSTTGIDFSLYGFGVYCLLPSIGGAFAAGNIYAQNNVYAGSNVLLGDVAEYFDVEGGTEPGDIIALKINGRYSISNIPYNPHLIGVHSTNPTVTLNTPSGTPVSLSGRVPVKVSGENGFIRSGDFLTSSSVKGHAMKADKSCFVIGRALENFEQNGQGKLICIVEPGWYNPSSSGQNAGGSFFIKKGEVSETITDNAVLKDSRIFITFRSRIGTDYWIDSVADGTFIIRLDNPAEKDIPVDYFIDNARLISGDVKTSEVFKTSDVLTISPPGLLPENRNSAPPPSPLQPENAWIWSDETGFKMTKDINTLKKERENYERKMAEELLNEQKEKETEEKRLLELREKKK